MQRQYKRFEDGLYRIAEGLRKSDPERADLLLRAIGKSKEERIATQMNELSSLLRSNKQLGEAIERQEDLITNLQVILDLLLSEDRQKELQEEQKRIKAYLEEVNKLIGKEKGNRADNERGVPGRCRGGPEEDSSPDGRTAKEDGPGRPGQAGEGRIGSDQAGSPVKAWRKPGRRPERGRPQGG